MKTNLSHEFYKMIHQRSSWVAVIVLFGLMLYSATPTAYITKNLISQGFGTGQWVIIIMITLSANFIAMELKNNTMTTLLYKSPNRWGVFVAKLIVLIVYSIVLLIAGFIFTLIIKAVLVNSHFTWQSIYHQHTLFNSLLLNLLGVGIYLLFIITLSMLLISLFKSSAVVIVIGLFIGFLGANISALIMQTFPGIKSIIAWNPLNMINIITQLSNSRVIQSSALTNNELIIGNLIYVVVFLLIGILVFRKISL
ncbi:ABC transporter permease [Limosilactobacillus sp. RRLNB_1_1]|uniref:ABC transporter permease n=1 Tax=Limosilactobacillus albertensis TaxID=2759752 RepID=A0A7W3TQ68_9LACO|nr:ABC transporter permease [Limosilactobacillus albertensis]MBB1068887.1 ABC transporter permease [Limosilactobacillus albertensis]MCD7118646.1 ABC transporter permease [Limosilactobacillus albertensis]MCD7128205.1 ABC transporter permease [Limosilactobacillus albertensis]